MAGIATAVLWVAIGLGVAWLSAQAGAPTASGWLALLSGPVALLIAGRIFNIRGPRDWIGVGAVGIVAVFGVGFAAIFMLTMLTAGRGFPGSLTETPDGSPAPGAAAGPSDSITTYSADPTAPLLTMDPSDVNHIVAAIDELAAADGDEISSWFNREGDWVTEHVNVAFVEHAAVSAYTDRIIGALQKMGDGRFDLTDEVTAILALRDEIAVLAPP